MKQYTSLTFLARAAAVVLTLTAAATACDKPYEMDLPLAVNQHAISLKKAAGSTHILVWSDGAWTASFDRPIDWASLNKVSGMGNSDIVFTYAANYGISRSVGIVLEKGELRDTIKISQDGPYTIDGESGHSDFGLQFVSPTMTLIRPGTLVRGRYTATVPYSMDNLSASAEFFTEDGISQGTIVMGQEIPDTMKITPWLSFEEINSTNVLYNVTENTSGALRTAVVTLAATDAKGNFIQTRQTVMQTLDDPALQLSKDKMEVIGSNGTFTVDCTQNNVYAYMDNIQYIKTADWITSALLSGEGLTFSVLPNDTGAARSGDITVSFSDAAGNNIVQTVTLTQLPFFSFEDARALPAGEITSDQVLDGYIVSSPESANNCQNPQTGQFRFDTEETYRTAIFQSTDGKLGFMLKFNNIADNTFPRYTRLLLKIKGLTLVKTTDPVSYTLTGISADNIYDVQDANPKLPVKKRNIEDLTDEDINTLVDLQDIEIMCKDGAYTNCTDGYSIKAGPNPISGTGSAPRWDCAPLLMSDRGGNVIYMLTNSMVEWRRSGTKYGNGTQVVAQGSGTYRGVITAETLVRYGDIGRYQVRPIEKSDIILADKAFSTTLVEWNWNDKKADVLPEIGEGTLNLYGSTIAANSDFNSMMPHEESLTKGNAGLIPSAALIVTNSWWDFTNDVGRYFDMSFSTSGIRGTNLVFGLVWNHGQMNNTTLDSPAHWKLLYSLDDGTTFNEVPDAGIIDNRSIVWWTTTSQDACPGFKDHLIKLPNECFNREKVILRMQVADKVTDKAPATSASTYLDALGIEQGTLTNKSTGIRIGTITIRYN